MLITKVFAGFIPRKWAGFLKLHTKKVLMVGFYGASNLGDELMLETFLSYLQKRKDLDISVMLYKNRKYDTSKYENVNFIYVPKNVSELDSIADNFDIIIFSGGAIIDDNLFNNKKPDLLDLGTMLIELSDRVIKLNKKLLCISLSSNKELINPMYISCLKKVIKSANHFSLRDENTFRSLKNVGINLTNVKCVYDIVLANKNLIDTYAINEKEEYNIGLNMICTEDTKGKFNLIIDSIVDSMKERGVRKFHINLLPFYNYKENDNKFYSELVKDSKHKDFLSVCEMPICMFDLKKLLLMQKFIISMRYHCSLISLILKIPTLVISYDSHSHYYNKNNFLKTFFRMPLLEFSQINNISIRNSIIEAIKNKNVDSKEIMLHTRENILKIIKHI